MKRLTISILVLFSVLLAAYFILRIWRGVHLLGLSPSKENFLETVRLIPLSSDPFYRMSLFHEWEMKIVDPQESLKFLSGAIERNPFEQRYWLNLAELLHLLGGPIVDMPTNLIGVILSCPLGTNVQHHPTNIQVP